MQKIIFKKTIDLKHELKELKSISVDETINYKLERDGIRAIGSIIIKGNYKDDTQLIDFNDSIDLDIFADFNKIFDKRDFLVKVDDFDYYIIDGNLNMSIEASVNGVKDDNERIIETSDSTLEEVENLIEEIEDNVRNEALIQSEIEEVSNSSENVEEVLENDDDIGVYYFYIVKEGDSYSSISLAYNVNEERLKDYNHNKEMEKGQIIIIPYGLWWCY